MRWFILMGDNDQIYSSEFSLLELESVMIKLSHEFNDVVRYWEVVEGIGHELDPRYLKFMMKYVRESVVANSVTDFSSEVITSEATEKILSYEPEIWSESQPLTYQTNDEDWIRM